MKKVVLLSLALLFCSTALFAVSNKTEPVKTQMTVKNVKTIYDAILQGCEDRGWIPSKSGENEVTATLDTRGHKVVVRIPYSKSGYEIIYKDSKNMNYSANRGTIHPKYNQWVANLDKSIKSSIDFKKEME
jgi:hypothetical protein